MDITGLKKQNIVLLTITVIGINLLTINGLPASLNSQNLIDVIPTQKPVNNYDVTCWDIFNNPYIESIPHPTNCSLFYKCSPDINWDPQPILTFCEPITLHFNLETCSCEWPGTTVCFDPINEEHNKKKFQCACPLEKQTKGDLKVNDKCSIGERKLQV